MTETGMVDVAGLGIRGRGDAQGSNAPWVVFSNSLGTALEVWDAQAAALSPRFRILRYDQRGHGGSGVPAEPCDFRRLGADLLALLDRFDIRRCCLVGLSMGVPTALQAFESRPDRFERLVLCDGQAATAAGGADIWSQRIEQARNEGMAALADATMARWFSPEFVRSGSADRVRAMMAATPLEGLVACIRALQGYDYAHVPATIDVPCLLMVGDRDGGLPAVMGRPRDGTAGGELVESGGR